MFPNPRIKGSRFVEFYLHDPVTAIASSMPVQPRSRSLWIHSAARDGGYPTVAGELLGLSVARVGNREERPAARHPSATPALPAAQPSVPYPAPYP